MRRRNARAALPLWTLAWVLGVRASCLFAEGAAAGLPAPAEDAQAKARAVVREVFGKEFQQAKSPAQKTALARQLLAQAAKTEGDPAGKYVLLVEARDLACEAADLAAAVEAIDRLAVAFAVDAPALKEEAIQAAGRAAKLPSQSAAVARQGLGLADAAVMADDYPRAQRLISLAGEIARRGRDVALSRQIAARVRAIDQQAAEYAEAAKARATLGTRPDDPEANLTVGRFVCFVKGDFQRGIAHLALGSDAALKDLATRELQGAGTPEAQTKLGDDWWDRAQAAEGTVRDVMLLHAGWWYKQAMPSLGGLEKLRVEKRLGEIVQVRAAVTVTPPPAPAIGPAPVPKTLTNSIGMKLVLLPAGEFLMGSTDQEVERLVQEGKARGMDQTYLERTPCEKPQHRVKITRPFYMGVYEVTQAEYQAVMGANPSYFGRFQTGAERDRRPVEKPTWDQAVEFCAKLSARPEEKKAGRVYRLPTEAEWEYACRAGSRTRYSFGDDEALADEHAWHAGNSAGKTQMVGQMKPNPWGLYDMHGNVAEWCRDSWGWDYYKRSPPEDPPGPAPTQFHVLRGGSWWAKAPYARSALRTNWNGNGHHVGFRVIEESRQ